MNALPFAQVYDMSLLRLQEAVDLQLKMAEQTASMGTRRHLPETVHWLAGAIHQWHSTMIFLCEVATKPGAERSVTAARVDVDRRRLEVEIAASVEEMSNPKQ
jgi:hypothetical protein